jgi:hypothetical protein
MGSAAQPARQTPPSAVLGTVATEVRGSLLASSLAVVRLRGRETAYFGALPPSQHQAIQELVAQAWLPVELAVAHYRALDHAFPQADEQRENGVLVAERTQNAYVETVVRGLKAAGALNMTTALQRVPAGIARTVRGGVCQVHSTGLKDARVELSGFPFLAVRYTHNAWQGMFESSLGIVSRKLFIRQDRAFAGADRMALVLSWV